MSNQLRNEQQVIIVYPDKIPGTIGLDDAFSKSQIGGLVCCPVFVRGGIFGRDILPKKIVEEGPESCNKPSQSCRWKPSKWLNQKISGKNSRVLRLSIQ